MAILTLRRARGSALASKSRRAKKSGSKKPRVINRKVRDGGNGGGSDPLVPVNPPGFFRRMLGRFRPDSIFKDGRVDIKPGKIITEPFEVLAMYALDRHKQEFEDERDSCPFNTNLETEELVFKQQMTWFLFVRRDSSTDITIAEEFVKEYNLPEDDAEEILQLTKMFPGHFKVVEQRRRDIILYDTDRRKKYAVVTRNPSAYPSGCIVLGCIHPYGDRYKICGIPTIAIPPP